METPTSRSLVNQISATISSPTDTRTPTPSSQLQPSTPNESRNPVSLRLFKVLGANYDDPSTKEALEIISSLYISPRGASASTTLKPSKVTSPKGTSDEAGDESDDDKTTIMTTNASTLVSDFDVGGVVGRARRNLRRDMENKLAQSSRKFLTAFSEVNKVGLYVVVGTNTKHWQRTWIFYKTKLGTCNPNVIPHNHSYKKRAKHAHIY